MFKSIIIFCLIVIFSCQDMDFPPKPDGIMIGDPYSDIFFEAFLDPLCPDSKKSFRSIQRAMINRFYKNDQLQIKATFHLFPLPFRRNSFTVCQLGEYIKEKYGNVALLQYLNLMFDEQEKFSNAATQTWSQEEVEAQLIDLTIGYFKQNSAVPLDLTKEELQEGLLDQGLHEAAKLSWKYGCIRSVPITPTFFANEIKMGPTLQWGELEWIQFFRKWIPDDSLNNNNSSNSQSDQGAIQENIEQQNDIQSLHQTEHQDDKEVIQLSAQQTPSSSQFSRVTHLKSEEDQAEQNPNIINIDDVISSPIQQNENPNLIKIDEVVPQKQEAQPNPSFLKIDEVVGDIKINQLQNTPSDIST